MQKKKQKNNVPKVLSLGEMKLIQNKRNVKKKEFQFFNNELYTMYIQLISGLTMFRILFVIQVLGALSLHHLYLYSFRFWSAKRKEKKTISRFANNNIRYKFCENLNK